MHLENNLKISDAPERQTIPLNFYPSFGTGQVLKFVHRYFNFTDYY